jgi:UDP-glucose 4-epimerase
VAVLVTGGAGYIGSHMVLALTDRGEDTVVLDNLSTGVRANVAAGARFVEGNIGDAALVAKIIREHRIDAIVHFAGSIVVPDSVTDPLGYYLNNTVHSRSLIAEAVNAQVPRFIFSSTAAVYGIPEAGAVGEDAILAPISPYGSSKLMTEWMLRDTAAAHGLSYVALRYFNVAGADPKGRSGQSTPRATHLIKVACELAVGKRSSMQIFGRDYPTPDGTCVRDYIHVSDLIAAHVDALDWMRAASGRTAVLNCGYGRGASVLEVIDAVEKASGKTLAVSDAPRRAGDPPSLVARADRIRAEFGWTPKHESLDEIVRSALAWERKLAHGS